MNVILQTYTVQSLMLPQTTPKKCSPALGLWSRYCEYLFDSKCLKNRIKNIFEVQCMSLKFLLNRENYIKTTTIWYQNLLNYHPLLPIKILVIQIAKIQLSKVFQCRLYHLFSPLTWLSILTLKREKICIFVCNE